MKQEVPPIFIIAAIVVMLGLVAYGAVHALTPHETVVKTTAMKLPPAMQQRLLAMRQRAMASHPVVATTAATTTH